MLYVFTFEGEKKGTYALKVKEEKEGAFLKGREKRQSSSKGP